MTWKHDLTERLKQDLPVCPHEHTAHQEEKDVDSVTYWLTCADEMLYSVTLGKAEEPARFFERWSRQHQYEVARGFLHRLLVAEPETVPPIKPGGLLEDLLIIGQTTNETLKKTKSIMEMQADRIAVLEAAVETQGERLDSLDARLVATDKIVHSLPVGGGWDR